MYTNLIKEDIMELDVNFYALNHMYETVETIEMIKSDEIIYEYGYTHNIDDCVDEMLYEAEQQAEQKKTGIVSKMIDRIINFIRNVRIKILKAFGNEEKAKEIEDKLNKSKGNVKLNTYEKELKAIEEEENLFKEMINKIKNGTITEQDAEKVKNKHSNVMAIIGGVAGGAAAVGVTIKIVDLFKMRTKVKSVAESSEDAEKDLNDAKRSLEGKSEDSPSVKAAKEVINTYSEFSKQKARVVTNASTEVNNKINEVFAKENTDTNNKNDNTQQQNTQQPKAEQQNTQQPKAEQQNTQQQNTEQPKAEQQNTQQPKAEQQNTQQPKAEQQNTQQPKAEPKAEQQQNTEQPKAEPKAEQQNSENNKDLAKMTDSMYLALDTIKEILEPVISDNLISSFDELDVNATSEDSSYLIKRAQSLLDVYSGFLKYKDTKKIKDKYVEAKKYDLTDKGDSSDYHKYLAEMSNVKKSFRKLENESNLLREKMDLVKPKAMKESVDFIYDDLMMILDEF